MTPQDHTAGVMRNTSLSDKINMYVGYESINTSLKFYIAKNDLCNLLCKRYRPSACILP